jgi:hypothetical protein
MTRNNLKSMLRTTGKAAIFTFLFCFPYPARALVLWKLWKWFVVPFGIWPQITYLNSVCLVILSALFLVNVHKNQGEHIRPASDGTPSDPIQDLFMVTLETTLRCCLIFGISYGLHLLSPK